MAESCSAFLTASGISAALGEGTARLFSFEGLGGGTLEDVDEPEGYGTGLAEIQLLSSSAILSTASPVSSASVAAPSPADALRLLAPFIVLVRSFFLRSATLFLPFLADNGVLCPLVSLAAPVSLAAVLSSTSLSAASVSPFSASSPNVIAGAKFASTSFSLILNSRGTNRRRLFSMAKRSFEPYDVVARSR